MTTAYVTKSEFTKQKARLTRAVNSGVCERVLEAVEKTLDEWHGKAWPDDWSRWARALDDAYYKYMRFHEEHDYAVVSRFRSAFDRIHG